MADHDTYVSEDECKVCVRLRDVLNPRKTIIDYTYDFGDNWKHRLTVTHVRAGEPDFSYQRYIGGERNGPPEDCGGMPGFYELLEALADSSHPEHADLQEWAGDYDPDSTSTAQPVPCGTFNSSTIMVMMIAMTPSLNAARRSFPMAVFPFAVSVAGNRHS